MPKLLAPLMDLSLAQTQKSLSPRTGHIVLYKSSPSLWNRLIPSRLGTLAVWLVTVLQPIASNMTFFGYALCLSLFDMSMLIRASAYDIDCEQESLTVLRKNLDNYDKTVIPDKKGVLVNVELHIPEISSISELSGSFDLDVLFSSIWTDPRLDYRGSKCILTNLTLDFSFATKIWTPNTCIINSKSAKIHQSPSHNVMLTLYDNGTIWQNYRMRVTGPCNINLRKFPFDTQTCNLVIESYSFNVQRVRLQWLQTTPITLMNEVNLPDFDMVNWEVEKRTIEYPNGRWDQLMVQFIFKRRYGFFILQAYIPTLMTIAVAWISLWMDTRQISARATLGISSFLAMTLQFGNILKNQPRVSYIKGLDIWMLGGILFMFATLAELAIISYCQQRHGYQCNYSGGSPSPICLPSTPVGRRLATANQPDTGSPNGFLCGDSDHKGTGLPVPGADDDAITPSRVDDLCRKLFAAVFLAFNVFYWLYYVGF